MMPSLRASAALAGIGFVALSLTAAGTAGRLAPQGSAVALPGVPLSFGGPAGAAALAPLRSPAPDDLARMRIPASLGRPKIVYSFNPDDDLAAIRRAGFTHVLVSYLQGLPDEEQRRKLDECQQHGLKLIYRMVDLVDRDRRSGGDTRTEHAVMLLRDHPALAGWQTYEETNLPPAAQIATYRKIKRWDPKHPVIVVTTNEYSPGWYQRTYSDDAQDLLMVDFYPYKRRYDGWVYLRQAVPALRAAQKRPVPIIPILQASSATSVASSDDTVWPPSGGLEKQLNLWWGLGADAGVACWLWRGSKEYPFVGIADPMAPAYALRETTDLLARIPDGELPRGTAEVNDRSGRQRKASEREIAAVRVWEPRVNVLMNSGFERGLEGWEGYNEAGKPTDRAYAGRGAVRMKNAGPPQTMGVVQRTDMQVPPNATVTLSCYYKIVRETARLQWTLNTTAFPKFGAAEFLERRERLATGEWRRGSISATNTTGAPQRVTSVSVSSNGFTGEVLLDNFQLELGPQASAYTTRVAEGGHPRRREPLLRYDLRARPSQLQIKRTPPAGTAPAHRLGSARTLSPSGEWTLSAWCAPEAPPAPGQYACLATLTPDTGPSVELRLRVDPERSDLNGWVGVLELATDAATLIRMPMALAPGQPLYWALSRTSGGDWTLAAAPAGYRLRSATARGGWHGGPRSVSLGADGNGEHALNGRVGGGRFVPRALSLAEAERLRDTVE